MGNFNDIREDIENLKDIFNEDIEKILDESLKYFDNGDFYQFLDNLYFILHFKTIVNKKDREILESWIRFSRDFINEGFIRTYKGEFISFSKLVDENVLEVVNGECLKRFNEEKQDLLNGDLYFPKKIIYISDTAFRRSSYLKKVVLHENFVDIEDKAFAESNLEEFYCLSAINVIKKETFISCHSLKEVHFKYPISEVRDGAFMYCTSLKEIDLGDKITMIDREAFARCFSLNKFNFGNSLKHIGNNSFYKDESLRDITLPESMYYVGKDAFRDCSNLDLKIPCTCSFDKGSFEGIKSFDPYIPKEKERNYDLI